MLIAWRSAGARPGERVDLGGESSGNLIAAIAGEPDQLDPHKTSAYFSFEVLENVFDTLVEPDATSRCGRRWPSRGTSAPTSSSGPSTCASGVTFHDGSPFTADDVVYSYRRIIDEQLTNADKFSAVTDVSAPEPADRRHPGQAADAEPADQHRRLQGHGDRVAPQRRERADRHPPVGTGPFSFAGQKSGDSITLKANPSYWGGAPEGLGCDLPVHLRTVDRAVGAAGGRDRLDRLDSAAAGRPAA